MTEVFNVGKTIKILADLISLKTLNDPEGSDFYQATKKQRSRELVEVSCELESNYMKKFIGREISVLVEEYKDGYSIGHTGNYLHVKIKGEYPHNSIVKCKINSLEYPFCIAE